MACDHAVGRKIVIIIPSIRHSRLVIGAGIASNVDNLIRPIVYWRVSNIHPMITLVGAFAGVRYFGVLGILLGPLAIAYLFELLRAYRQEHAQEYAPVAESGLPATAGRATER
jgi:predicted PurR-regulated permease PerM